MNHTTAASALLLSALLLAPSTASAEGDLDAVPVRLGFFAPYGIQPGGRLAIFHEFNLSPVDATLDTDTLRTNLFIGPEIGVFTRPQSHTSVLVGVLLGYRFLTSPKDRFHELSLGIAYIGESQITSLDVELATGDTTKNRELRSHALPTVRYTFGRELTDRWGWTLDLAVGRMMSWQVPSALYLSAGAGLQFRFGG